MRAVTLALMAAALAGLAAPGWAQTAAPAAPAPQVQTPVPAATDSPAAADEADKVVTPQNLTLEVGRGTMVRLPEPAASVLAADPAVARVQPASPTRLFLIAVAPGHTTVLATNNAGGTIAQFEVTVHGDAAASAAATDATGAAASVHADPVSAESAIAASVRGAVGIKVRGIGKDLVLTGVVPTPAAAQEAVAIAHAYLGGDKATVVDQLLVLSSIQVSVRVRFAEISRTITHELGFNWQALAGSKGGVATGGFQFGLLTGAANTGVTIASTIPTGLAAPNGVLANQIGFGSTRWDINNVIDALASDQLITILAEPNLTALSGETASFLAGGEFPVPVAATNTQITISFKQFGISLAVVPTVLAADRLNLKVRPEVSELSDTGAINVPLAGGTLKIPALTVRRAETTIELGSGQSFAIAGLLQKNTSDQINALPGLGELPVLGALFKSDAFQRSETELVIIVTPYLVNPVSSPAKLRAPTDGFKPANDLDRILFSRQLAKGSTAGTTSIDAGFILR